MTAIKTVPCPSCVLVEHYYKDGAFAAYMDYQNHFEAFMLRVQSTVSLLLTGTFENGAGINISKRHSKAYVMTGLGLLGFPDVAAIMETDANEAKRLMQDRLSNLVDWSLEELDCEQSDDQLVSGALSQWKKHAGELAKECTSVREPLRLAR